MYKVGENLRKLTSLMLSWPPGPCLTLRKRQLHGTSKASRSVTYLRVGLKSWGSSGSQKVDMLLFPPGFVRTRLTIKKVLDKR